MANVTFSSPLMPRDVTVYAVAGERGTLLALAKAHHIPIPFDCQDGECGSCLVQVRHYRAGVRYGVALTEKEKEVLKQLGKITKQEIMDAEVNDMPPRHRLACQCFVRDEDIAVEFEGDVTLPMKGPALSIAAAIYKGGVGIRTLDQFLSYAVKVEEDAAIHFEQLAQAMGEAGNADVAALFAQLAGYSRLHLDEAKAKCTRYQAVLELPASSAWPDNTTPEKTTLWEGDPALRRLDALKAALQGERRGYEFYYAIAHTTKDEQIRAVAKEFVKEEAEHVEKLKQWIAQEEATVRRAAVPVA
ncbi:2Fe-2S iron-sulfur cluster-binding protein [Aquabacterium sp. OR-4]|uniref:2Fe-2S iron-sulfur cluster-binding protein n=1 Tax=Aquabacterium sp. OR-4 TaxID=2978127 RepID=UPI0028C7C976|nr:2Fe-2S iron-sulfur cluster-binding protein [Aquabacterium sp. OR-4]MDT7838098.1 2Fe-2S iron-sulfur cluster-binding protein [Aquabacterium sp. OR-4]